MNAVEQLLSDACDVIDEGVHGNVETRAELVELLNAGQRPSCVRVILPGTTVMIVVSKV